VRAGYYTPRFSPDGKRLAFSLALGQTSDIWVKELDRDTPSRLTLLKGTNTWPIWTPDGKNIVFRSDDPASTGLHWAHADGSGAVLRLSDGDSYVPNALSPDGKWLAMSSRSQVGPILTARIEGDAGNPKLGKPEMLPGATGDEFNAEFSPDGRW